MKQIVLAGSIFILTISFSHAQSKNIPALLSSNEWWLESEKTTGDTLVYIHKTLPVEKWNVRSDVFKKDGTYSWDLHPKCKSPVQSRGEGKWKLTGNKIVEVNYWLGDEGNGHSVTEKYQLLEINKNKLKLKRI